MLPYPASAQTRFGLVPIMSRASSRTGAVHSRFPRAELLRMQRVYDSVPRPAARLTLRTVLSSPGIHEVDGPDARFRSSIPRLRISMPTLRRPLTVGRRMAWMHSGSLRLTMQRTLTAYSVPVFTGALVCPISFIPSIHQDL